MLHDNKQLLTILIKIDKIVRWEMYRRAKDLTSEGFPCLGLRMNGYRFSKMATTVS